MPRFFATAIYIAMITAAGALIVMETVSLFIGIPENNSSMSSIVSIATPSQPTSCRESGASESSPYSVGRSKAVESPVPPKEMIFLNLSFVCRAHPCPANCLTVGFLFRYISGKIPRVKGYLPGSFSFVK